MRDLARRQIMVLLFALFIPLIAACGDNTTESQAPAATIGAETSAPAGVTIEATAAPAAPTTEAPMEETAVATSAATAEAGAGAAAEGTELPVVNPAEVSGDIIVAGSSTVYPLTERIAEIFEQEGYTGQITIDSVGSGAGFERFCNGETDISNASRAIEDEEVQTCQANNIEPIEFRVGTDALAIVVNAENDFVDGLTMDQLAQIFSGQAQTWADVNPDWPAEPIQLFSPGTDSGTFDYFVEEVFADVPEDQREAQILNAQPQLSENDNVLVQGVQGSPYAIGYFGYAYYEANRDTLKAAPIDGVEPSTETVEGGEYPLARPLFIYSAPRIFDSKPQTPAFINYYLSNVNDVINDVGYFPASEQALDDARQKLVQASLGE